MATYTNVNGRLRCTGSDITAAGIKAAIDANPPVGTAAVISIAGAGNMYAFTAEIDIGDGTSTASLWNITRDWILVKATHFNITGSGAELRLGNQSSGISIDGAAFLFVGGQDGWQILNGAKLTAYGSLVRASDRIAPSANSVIILLDCDLELEDGIGAPSGSGVFSGHTVNYSNSRVHNTSGVGLKLYNPSAATLNNVRIEQCVYAFQPGNQAITLTNAKIDSCTYHTVPNQGNCNLTFINPDFLTLRPSLEDGSDVTRIEFVFTLTVRDSSGTPISGAGVYLADAQSNVRFNGVTDSGGLLSGFGGTFQNSTWAGSTKTDRALHTLRVRNYGYNEYTGNRSAVANDIESLYLTANQFVVASKSTALAYSGITVSFSARTIQITASVTLQQLYDYLEAHKQDSGNMPYASMISTADGLAFALDASLTVDTGQTLSGTAGQRLVLSAGKALTLSGTGNVTIPVAYDAGTRVPLSVSGLVNDSHVRIQKTSDATLIAEGSVSGTTFTAYYVWTMDLAITLRVRKASAAPKYLPYEAASIITNSGLSMIAAQVEDIIAEAA
jgi:hypothetical protein